MGVVSSEEIAAALESAIAHLRGYERADMKDVATITAHLSRLREEAAFRDAALAYAEWATMSAAALPQIDTSQTYLWMEELGRRQQRLHDTFRALEEPRDAD